jgi:hypothetical protein
MKYILTILCATALAALGDIGPTQFPLATNRVGVSYTNTVATSNLWVGADNLSLYWSVKPVTNAAAPAGVGSAIFRFSVSPDSGFGNTVYTNSADYTFYTATGFDVTVTYNGTNLVSGWTNISTDGWRRLRLDSMGNTGTNLVLTNIALRYFWKQ